MLYVHGIDKKRLNLGMIYDLKNYNVDLFCCEMFVG